MSESDAGLAGRLATEAGVLLLELWASDADNRGAEGDRLANTHILSCLRRLRPDDAILSEEEADDRARCGARRVWIVDPLDGTREFGERRKDWAVHVALAECGLPVLGAVALPAHGVTLTSDSPPLLGALGQPLRIVLSRSRPPEVALRVARALGATQVPMGSAGAKAMAVVCGEADLYLHAGGQYEWDNCAPAAVALAAGLHVSRLDGSPLRYNNVDPYLPDLLIARRELADKVLALLR